MQTTMDLEKTIRNIQLKLTLRNWEVSLKILNDLYADLGEWDYHDACGWLVKSGKRPYRSPNEQGKLYCWHVLGNVKDPTKCLKGSFVHRIDRAIGRPVTSKLYPQLAGFLEAWKQGGRPEGKDKKSFSRLLIKELTWKNWFSTLHALARFGFSSRQQWKVDACNWLVRNAKRPWVSQFGYYTWLLSEAPGQETLPPRVVARIDRINGENKTTTIQPQLLAFIQAWEDGVRP